MYYNKYNEMYYNKEEQKNTEYITKKILFSNICRNKLIKQSFFKNHRYILSTLNEKEADIFCSYYGLNNDVFENYTQIASRYGCRHQLIGDIMNKIIGKLVNPMRGRLLFCFTDQEIGCNENNYMQFDIDTLNNIFRQKQKERELSRLQNLNEEEQKAELVLNAIVNIRLVKFNINSNRYKTMSDLLSISPEEYNSPQYQKMIDRIHSLGLIFYCEVNYKSEWLDKCRKKILEVGINNVMEKLQINDLKHVDNDRAFNELINRPIEELDLPIRAYNCLNYESIETIEDLVKLSQDELLDIKSLGAKGFKAIIVKLHSLGLDIRPNNINPDEWIYKLAKINKVNNQYKTKTSEVKEEGDINESTIGKLLNTTIEDMGLSTRSYNGLKRVSINTLRDLIKLTRQDLLDIKNLGEKSFNEIIKKVSELGLDMRPDNMSANEWLAEVNGKKTNSKTQHFKPDLDINEIPEKYRKIYAIGAMVEAEKDLKDLTSSNRLILRAIIDNARNVKADPLIRKVKLGEKEINQINDEDLLKLVVKDPLMINNLDGEFITKYKNQLIRIIAENNTLSVEEKFNLVDNINYIQESCMHTH